MWVLTYSRHRVQATTTEGLAANLDTEGCVADSVHHRIDLCTHRRSYHLGKRKGHQHHLGLHGMRHSLVIINTDAKRQVEL